MAQFSYDVVEQDGGWAIVIKPSRLDTFPTKQAAFDAAVELARKLRFAGHSISIDVEHEPRKAVGTH
jgi:hypothetical protein